MNIELDKMIEGKSIEEIVIIRDEEFDTGSEEWEYLNIKKSELLEKTKPSLSDEIVSFNEISLLNIPNGFSFADDVPNVRYQTIKRSLVEYNPEKRHPIPYCIVKYGKTYFFTKRIQGSSEVRLMNKLGLLGGHVDKEDVDAFSLGKTIVNALMRELKEEAGITDEMIDNIALKGFIKATEGVDADHLGVVYILDVNTNKIKAEEDGVLQGIWIHEKNLLAHYNEFESWTKIVYDNLLK